MSGPSSKAKLKPQSTMSPPSRRQRVSRLNKHQPQRQKHQHVSNGQDTVWLPDQSTETSLIGEGSSTHDYTQKLQVLQDQLDKAQTIEIKENKIRELTT